MSLKTKILLSALFGIAIGLAFAGVHFFREARRSSQQSTLQIFGTVPDFNLVERSGLPVSREDLKGKVWVADFVFTHCSGPCPLLSQTMSRLQSAVQSMPGVQLVSFTVDPERDSPTVLTEYATRFDADAKRWYFLTGPKPQMYDLIAKGFLLGLEETTSEVGQITHSTRFVLVDQEGRIRGYYDGSEPGMGQKLLPDIQSLIAN